MPEPTTAMPQTDTRTRWPTIVKRRGAIGVVPNLVDYGRACAEFSWNDARRWLAGLPHGRGLNIAHEAID